MKRQQLFLMLLALLALLFMGTTVFAASTQVHPVQMLSFEKTNSSSATYNFEPQAVGQTAETATSSTYQVSTSFTGLAVAEPVSIYLPVVIQE